MARSTIAKILKEQGIPPSGERPMSWRTFLRAHWTAVCAADFFTTEVWTSRGLVTYTLFVIELHSRRVHVVGSTPPRDDGFMLQIARALTDSVDGVLNCQRFLICDRDRKWSTAVEAVLETAGVRLVRTPLPGTELQCARRTVVRPVKEECLDRIVPLGERHFHSTLKNFVAHYHRERNQGLGNQLIDGVVLPYRRRPVRRHQRVGGVLSYYDRAA